MIELYVYSTKMSPEKYGVFQLLKEVTFEEFWHFTAKENEAIFGVLGARLVRFWLAGGTGPRNLASFHKIKRGVTCFLGK